MMTQILIGVTRVLGSCACTPRKRMVYFLLVTAAIFSIIIVSVAKSRLAREDQMEQQLSTMRERMHFLQSLYQSRQEDVMVLKAKLLHQETGSKNRLSVIDGSSPPLPNARVIAMLQNMTGTRAALGIQPTELQTLRMPFVYQLLPHLMNDPFSLRPAYHMKGGRYLSDVVIGIPTVKRDKESYLMITLTHLINGLSEKEKASTLIIVMIGETDLEYVLNVARQIEVMFPKEVENGLIEVLSPSPSYYPDFESMPTTLGDSQKRVKWRTKQNLDTIYLMIYARLKGTFYLMLEDDVIAKKNYMQEIKQFITTTSFYNPDWVFIEFCTVGGIGKLFRSSDLVRFITYVQLFYNNMPIDWLLESYLADKVCTIAKTSNACSKSKLLIRPRYKMSLFQHIGLYSSLKGKIQKVKDTHYGTVPTFYPHKNPPVQKIRTTIEEHSDHTIKRAYEGLTYFWGVKPKKGDVIEFWFEKPILIERYTFRTGNVEHVSDKIQECAIEVMPVNGNFTQIGKFDEFGLADGEINKELGEIVALRLKILKDSVYWAIISEIELKTVDSDSRLQYDNNTWKYLMKKFMIDRN